LLGQFNLPKFFERSPRMYGSPLLSTYPLNISQLCTVFYAGPAEDP